MRPKNRTPGEWYRTRAPFTIGLREGREEGLRLSKLALRSVLAARGLVASDEQLAVIDGCMAIDALAHWITRAASVSSVAELLAA